MDSHTLVELANYTMPFGRYAGRRLVELPESYLIWFQTKGWPEGKLGIMLRSMLEIKINGLEYLLRPLVRREMTPP